ncbi:unnamed protein product [Symbiodinium microadriaticum]|nr:unnamed protein product [Symbiodinium sp. KB8]CAE7810061.1 unnamed protein product [Symbiodinium microadriaticum]
MASPHNRMLDDAMAKYAAKEWTIQEHSTPVYVNNSQADFSECIRLSDLEKHACRRDLPKTCVLVLDAHYQISEFGNLLSVCERLSNQDYSALPPRLQPTTSLPHGSTSMLSSAVFRDIMSFGGFDFVNKNAPDDDSENLQYLWILTNIKPDSGSPIAGWPEGKIIRMAQNKRRTNVL